MHTSPVLTIPLSISNCKQADVGVVGSFAGPSQWPRSQPATRRRDNRRAAPVPHAKLCRGVSRTESAGPLASEFLQIVHGRTVRRPDIGASGPIHLASGKRFQPPFPRPTSIRSWLRCGRDFGLAWPARFATDSSRARSVCGRRSLLARRPGSAIQEWVPKTPAKRPAIVNCRSNVGHSIASLGPMILMCFRTPLCLRWPWSPRSILQDIPPAFFPHRREPDWKACRPAPRETCWPPDRVGRPCGSTTPR